MRSFAGRVTGACHWLAKTPKMQKAAGKPAAFDIYLLVALHRGRRPSVWIGLESGGFQAGDLELGIDARGE